jgi:PTH2 family peptidyl-tRNA hydrolase
MGGRGTAAMLRKIAGGAARALAAAKGGGGAGATEPAAAAAAAAAAGEGAAAAAPAPALRIRAAGKSKMAIILRTDLDMGKGKLVAQGAHAAVHAVEAAAAGTRDQRDALRAWRATGGMKVALRADSEAALLALADAAETRGLVTAVIRDAGHTQVAAGTTTALAVGPGAGDDVDAVTGSLKLL